MRVLFGTYVVWLVVCIYAVAYVMKNIYSVWYVCIIFLNTYFAVMCGVVCIKTFGNIRNKMVAL